MLLPSHDYPLLIAGGKFIFKETSPAGDYRYLGMGGGTVTNTDLTIKGGRFTTVYAADYTGKVTDQAKAVLFNCRVYRLTPSYIGNTKGNVCGM